MTIRRTNGASQSVRHRAGTAWRRHIGTAYWEHRWGRESPTPNPFATIAPPIWASDAPFSQQHGASGKRQMLRLYLRTPVGARTGNASWIANETEMLARSVPISRRRWLRTSTRGLIVLVLIIGGWLGWLVPAVLILARDAVAAIKDVGGRTAYDWEMRNGRYGPGTEPWASVASRAHWYRLLRPRDRCLALHEFESQCSDGACWESLSTSATHRERSVSFRCWDGKSRESDEALETRYQQHSDH